MSNLQDIKTRKDIPKYLYDSCLIGNFIELGVHSGDNLKTLSTYSPRLLIGIDTWDGNPTGISVDRFNEDDCWDHYKKSIKVMLDNPCIKLIKGMSQKIIEVFDDSYFDFVYIDDDHSYEITKNSLNLWWNKVRVGGILAGHDYFNEHGFGVIQAVDEFRSEKNILDMNFHITSEVPPSFLIVKV